ncbi:hypothetical protein J4409_02870 [Candidatus Woesearchaeota archaeon]|nr:hypothetical protein [Candidatus Woesearchaeota archaeon]
MKHTLKISLLLIILFFLTQLIGLFITNSYLEKELPYNLARPEINQEKPIQSASAIFLIILIGTIIVLFFARFNLGFLWKIWFFLGVVFTLSISFSSIFSQIIAFILALILAFFKVVKRNLIIHNITELFIYGALAAVFVPVLNVTIMAVLLVIISIYDIIAVWKTKHMVKLMKFQSKLKLFAGLLIPYKNNIAVLGGGDLGFPLLFAGILLKDYGFKSIIVSVTAAIALAILLYKSEKKKYYPAMPFLTAGCLVGYLILVYLA